MIKQLIQLGAVLAIVFFLASAHGYEDAGQFVTPEISVMNWYLDPEVVYLSPILVERALKIAEQVYGKTQLPGGRLTVMMAPGFILNEDILAYYDFRIQTVFINPENYKKLEMIHKIYLLAHEFGHHFLRNQGVNDHCLMYGGDGYDFKVLTLLGVPEEQWYNYVDPILAMMSCGEDYY